MQPRTRMLPLIRGAAHSHTAALHSAAHLYAAAQPWCRACGQMVSSSTCCRDPCCHAVLCVAASRGAAQCHLLPRSMLPRSSLCCRVPWCRAVLHFSASHAAALRSTCGRASVLSAAPFYVRPRSMVPRAAQRLESSPCCRAVVWIAIKGGSFHSRRQSLDSRGGGWSSSDRRGSQSLDSRGGGWSSSDRRGRHSLPSPRHSH